MRPEGLDQAGEWTTFSLALGRIMQPTAATVLGSKEGGPEHSRDNALGEGSRTPAPLCFSSVDAAPGDLTRVQGAPHADEAVVRQTPASPWSGARTSLGTGNIVLAAPAEHQDKESSASPLSACHAGGFEAARAGV